MSAVNPIGPWVDAEEVRRLAQSLLMPVRREPEDAGDACFGDGFVGFAGPDMPVAASVAPAVTTPEADDATALQRIQGQARESLAGARERAEQGGLLERPAEPEAPAYPAVAPSTPPAPSPSAPETAVQPRSADQQAAPSPVAVVSPPPPLPRETDAPPPPAATRAPFVERLHAYGQWLHSAVEAKAFFVTDRDGHVLMDQVRSPKLLQVARTLAQASHTANRHAGGGEVGSLHVKLGESSILEVLPIDTSYGPLILGIVVPSVLSAPAIAVISKGLEQVVEGHAG